MKNSKKYMILFIIAIFAIIVILPTFSLSATMTASNGATGVSEDGINTVLILKEAIATWYYIIRVISIVIMLLVLIFIGIKMAITSVASDRAFYKRMLMDWVAGMVLVFGIHYIMLFIINMNELLVEMVQDTAEAVYEASPDQYGSLETKDNKDNTKKTDEDIEVSIYDTIRTRAYDPKLVNGMSGLVMYAYLVYYSYKFVFIYFKRYLTVAVLTLMSPAVAVSYALNKVLSGKTKIFSTWLKEYFLNVILQSVHAIIYVTFVMNALQLSLNSISGMLLAFMLLSFMSNADKIFRKIFAFGGNGSLVDDIADRNVGRELMNSFKGITKAYLGGKAMSGLANWEREKLFYNPARKAFGGVMAWRMNNREANPSDEEMHVDIAGNETNFTEKDYQEFENNDDVKEIVDKGMKINKIEKIKNNRRIIEKNKAEIKRKRERILKGLEKDIDAIEDEIDALQNKNEELERENSDLERETGVGHVDDKELDILQKIEEAKLKELNDKFSKTKLARTFAMNQKIKDVFDPSRYVEYDEEKGKYVGFRTKYKGRYYTDENGKVKYVERKKLSFAEKLFSEDSLTEDSLKNRMKANINLNKLTGMNDTDKQVITGELDAIKNLLTGFAGMLASIPTSVENPVIGFSAMFTSLSALSKSYEHVRKSAKAEYVPMDTIDLDAGFTLEDVENYARDIRIQTESAKDQYIVNEISTKHQKFVKALTKGTVVATGNIFGANLIEGVKPGKRIPTTYKRTKSGGFSYAQREKLFYNSTEITKETKALERKVVGIALANAIKTGAIEISEVSDDTNEIYKAAAVETGTAVEVNGMYIPTTDKEQDVKSMEKALEEKKNAEEVEEPIVVAAENMTLERFANELIKLKAQSPNVIGEINGTQINAQDYATAEDIIKAFSDSVGNKTADGNDEHATATVVEVNDKKILVTDQMIKQAISEAAANSKKSISEFATNDANIVAVEQRLQNIVLGKDAKKEDVQELTKALKTRVEKVKTDMVVSEFTTQSFQEIVDENDVKSVGDLKVTDVQERTAQKLENWVKAVPNQTASVLDNLSAKKKTISSIAGVQKQQNTPLFGQVAETDGTRKIAQPILGGRNIEETVNSSVQARHQAFTRLNSARVSENTDTATTEKMKRLVEEKRHQDMADMLTAVIAEKDEERRKELISSVPEPVQELAYMTIEIERNNIYAAQDKSRGKQAKHLEFEPRNTEDVVNSLNKIKKESIFGEYKGSGTNPESRVGEQDTSVREHQFTPNGAQGNTPNATQDNIPNGRRNVGNTGANGQNSTNIVTQRRKNGTIRSRELNSGLEKPMTDISALIEEIGKGRK